MRLSLLITCGLALASAGCLLDWSGGRPDARGADAAQPDAALPDAPAPAGDAAPDLLEVGVLFADVFVAPGPWKPVPAGSFTMGSPPAEPCRGAPTDGGYSVGFETQHTVTLTRPFEINALEVSQLQFKAVMGYKLTYHILPTHPATNLSWHDAAAYCNKLSERLGLQTCYEDLGSGKYCTSNPDAICLTDEFCLVNLKRCVLFSPRPQFKGAAIYGCPGYRLPTEAEWEYAFRAGTSSAYYNGKTSSPAACNACTPNDPNLDPIGWYCGNQSKLQIGGTRAPNALGLYDMAGNVYEWCHDGWAKDLGGAAATDPVTAVQGEHRVLRSGSYYSAPSRARAASRTVEKATSYDGTSGVRCVRSLPKPDAGP